MSHSLMHSVITLLLAAPLAFADGPARGRTVTELDNALWYVFQAKNGDYWFGSNDRGAYRYDGKTLTQFTTDDGLPSNRIGIGGFQEDKAGNIYIVSDGISKFDGRVFTTLRPPAGAVTSNWKLQPDDLWFAGSQDSGKVFRYDGTTLHPLEFPKTKAGNDATLPRDQFPNAKYSPYDVYTILKDSKGNVWFGTAVLGAVRYDGKSFAWLPEEELRHGSFGTRSIGEDREGKFWFSDSRHRYAVDLSDPARPRFKKVDGLRDSKEPDKRWFVGVISCTRDQNGDLWMATYGQGVWRYDGKTATHYPVTHEGKGINVFSIHRDRGGVMWLGTQAHGAYRFNGQSFERFKP